MNTTIITASRLTAAAGVCAAVAGALYVGVQINHPPADLDHITTTDVLVREVAKMTMSAFAIIGFTGMLVRNRHKFGIFGAVSYVMVLIGYFAMFANQVIVATVPRTDDAHPIIGAEHARPTPRRLPVAVVLARACRTDDDDALAHCTSPGDGSAIIRGAGHATL